MLGNQISILSSTTENEMEWNDVCLKESGDNIVDIL